jgi:CheY-like chemotaxis protein
MLRESILVVEDDYTLVSLMSVILRQEGYHIIHVRNANDALSIACSQQPTFILLDVYLGNIDGRVICRSLQEENATRDIPIIMTSGKIVKDDCLLSGAVEFLLKPWILEQLFDVLGHIRRGKRLGLYDSR